MSELKKQYCKDVHFLQVKLETETESYEHIMCLKLFKWVTNIGSKPFRSGKPTMSVHF